jgi:hypothetical protein
MYYYKLITNQPNDIAYYIQTNDHWLIDHVDGNETMSLNRSHQRAYCSSARWYMSMQNHGKMMMPAGENWLVLPAESSESK